MELPLEVLIHNQTLGVKGTRGTLLQVAEEGYYEVNMSFGEKVHRVLLPVETTVLIGREPETALEAPFEVER